MIEKRLVAPREMICTAARFGCTARWRPHEHLGEQRGAYHRR
jgi:hypothetical protein